MQAAPEVHQAWVGVGAQAEDAGQELGTHHSPQLTWFPPLALTQSPGQGRMQRGSWMGVTARSPTQGTTELECMPG